MFYACDHGHLDVVKVLLDKGADLTIKDTFYGFTPLMLAVSPAQKKRPEHTEIAKLLIAKGAPGKDDALSGAIESGDAALVKFILDSGGIPAPKLSEALEAAQVREQDRDGLRMLEKAGAKLPEEFKIDAAQLERFAGTYKNAGGNELIVVVAGARLAIGPAAAPPDQRAALAAKDATTFRAIGMGGMSVVFKIEADKVTGFTLMPPQGSPVVYTRWRESDDAPPQPSDRLRLSRSRSLALGAALAGVPRRERRRRRRRHADGRQVERGDRRERRVEDAGPRRRRFEPDRLGRPCVRVDRGQQRSEPGHSDRAVWRRRAGERLVEAHVAADRARQEVRQGPLGQGRLRRRSEDQAPSEIEPGVRDARDRRTPRHRLVRIARGCTPTTSTESCSGRRTSAC